MATQVSSLERSFSGVQLSLPQPLESPGPGRATPEESALIRHVLPLAV